MLKKAHNALDEMANFNQEQVDKICEAIASAGEQNSYLLAKMAVEETGRGVVEDKTIKICLLAKIFGTVFVMKKRLA